MPSLRETTFVGECASTEDQELEEEGSLPGTAQTDRILEEPTTISTQARSSAISVNLQGVTVGSFGVMKSNSQYKKKLLSLKYILHLCVMYVRELPPVKADLLIIIL